MMQKFATTIVAVLVLFLLTTAIAFAEDAWEMRFPLPEDDPRWKEVAVLWQEHWEGDNIDEILAVLHRLEADHPDQSAVHLWLSRAYYLKSRYHGRDREASLKQSEDHASRLLSLDPGNMTAMKLLLTAVTSYADLDYIADTYAEKLLRHLPVPVGRALPDLDLPAFSQALIYWDQREDIEKGKRAVDILRQLADAHPDNLTAQTWVARGDYYLGYYYLSQGDPETARPYFQEGNDYGQKALEIDSHSVPAHYLPQPNLSRSIQHANLFVKARSLNTIMNTLVFTANENTTYFYCGPLISTATIIEKGGWVAEKGLGLAGYKIETIINGLELAVIAYPTYLYTHFAKAEVQYHLGKKTEARYLLEKILEMDPYANPYHAPENICVQRLTRQFLEKNFPEEE